MSPRVRATLGWLLVVACALVVLATRLRVDADYAAFLPSAVSDEQRLLVSELQDGVTSRLLLIDLSGAPAEALAQASRLLQATLAADPQFRYATNGDAVTARPELDLLRAHRYVLSDRVDEHWFTVPGLQAALERSMRGLASGAGVIEKTLFAQDPTGETLYLIGRLRPASEPRREQGVWFDPSGTRALLLAQTAAAGSNLDAQARAVATLERAFAAARGDAAMALRYSSPGAMAVQSRTLIASDAQRLAVVSTVLILLVLWLAYRSWRVVVLCAVPALTGLLVAVAAVDLAFGSVHAITLGFGATLLGEAVDYPGYLLTQVREGESVFSTLGRIGRTLAIAALTTAAASSALFFAGFPGLAQLGLLTMAGVVVAAAVTAWALPYWVPAHFQAALPSATLAGFTARGDRRILWVIATLVVAGALTMTAGKTWWDDDLANMNPLPAALKQQDLELRTALGAPEVRYLVVVEGATREEVLTRGEALRPWLERVVAAGSLRGFDAVSDVLPSEATQRARRQALPDDATLRTNFAQAARDLPLRIEAVEPFFAAVASERAATEFLSPAVFAGTALGLKVDALLHRGGKGWYAVVPLSGVQDSAAIQQAIGAAQLAGVRWVDLQAATRGLMQDFRAHALYAFAAGGALVVAVLVLGLRSIAQGALVALPVAVAVAVTAAILVALGSPLTVFHLVALMLVAGIGTNYALFMARRSTVDDAPGAATRALVVVSATTLCAFGTLATSHTPVLHAIGLTVTLGVLASLLFAAALLPRRILPKPT